MDADGPTFRFIRHYFGFLYPLYIVAFLAVRRRTPGFDAQPRHWFSLFLFVLSFSQIRFAHLFVPAWILMWFSLASTMKTQRARWLVCAALSLCLLEPTLATRNQFSRGLTPVEKITLDIAKFLESRPEPGHVSAPPNMGNQLLYLTKRGVVTTPFFLPKYLRRDLDLRDETDIMALIHSERSQGIRFIVAADDVRYHTMLKRMFHREVTESTFEADLAPCSPTHLAHAYYRLACIPRNRPGLTVLGTFVVPGAYFASLYRTATVYRID
jgi:hypothetical protein